MTTEALSQNRAEPLRVLVAEDEALIRLDLVEMLKEEGYEVVGEAADGQSAVDLAVSLKPNLIVMDVKMPVRDGIDAATEIAKDRIAPVIILTAFSQREMVERARDAGAMAYLVKPLAQADLAPAIELAVSRFEELTALEKEVAGLAERLEARKVVDQAKGLLMDAHKLTEAQAFKWLQRSAMDRRVTMKSVAEAVIDTFSAKKAGEAAPLPGLADSDSNKVRPQRPRTRGAAQTAKAPEDSES
jgi:response regulator NasT